jgi:hypothetical protein
MPCWVSEVLLSSALQIHARLAARTRAASAAAHAAPEEVAADAAAVEAADARELKEESASIRMWIPIVAAEAAEADADAEEEVVAATAATNALTLAERVHLAAALSSLDARIPSCNAQTLVAAAAAADL